MICRLRNSIRRRCSSTRREQAIQRRYEDFFIVDIDGHHYETFSFAEMCEYIEDPVMRDQAKYQGFGGGGITTANGGYQESDGPRHALSRPCARRSAGDAHRDITLTKRWMDAIGIDSACLFPTPMLSLGLTPRPEVEVALSRAYNRWLCEVVLAHEPRIKSSLYLPFNDPEATYQMVQGFRRQEGRDRLHHLLAALQGDLRQRLYEDLRAIEEMGLPLVYHGAFTWGRIRACSALQPVPRGARAGLHLVQHPPHDELALQRDAGALPET